MKRIALLLALGACSKSSEQKPPPAHHIGGHVQKDPTTAKQMIANGATDMAGALKAWGDQTTQAAQAAGYDVSQ